MIRNTSRSARVSDSAGADYSSLHDASVDHNQSNIIGADMFAWYSYEVVMKEYIPTDQKIDNRPPRTFVANDPGLDLLNSIGTPADTVVEWIVSREGLLAWLVEARLLDAVQASASRANSFPGELNEVLAQARALREWFRDFVL